MKKRIFWAIIFAVSFVSVHAQFVLTPSDGLVYAQGVYTINRQATIEQNLQAASNAIKWVIPDAVIEQDPQNSNTLFASAKAVIKMGKSGAMSLNHKGTYTLGIEASTEGITIRFVRLSQFEHEQGSIIAPWKPDEKTIINYFVFKYDGKVRHKKAKLAIENWANDLVQEITKSIQ